MQSATEHLLGKKRKTTSEFKIKTIQLNTIYHYTNWVVSGACLMLCCQSASVHVQCVYGSLEVTYKGWWSPILHLRWYKLQQRCWNCYRNTGDVRVCLKKFLGFISRELVCSHIYYPWDVFFCFKTNFFILKQVLFQHLLSLDLLDLFHCLWVTVCHIAPNFCGWIFSWFLWITQNLWKFLSQNFLITLLSTGLDSCKIMKWWWITKIGLNYKIFWPQKQKLGVIWYRSHALYTSIAARLTIVVALLCVFFPLVVFRSGTRFK